MALAAWSDSPVVLQLEFASNQTEGERFLASARNDHKQRICHLEPFDFVQGDSFVILNEVEGHISNDEASSSASFEFR